MKRPFGPVIAQRRLVTLGARRKRLRVSLGQPRWNKREWECPFRISGTGVSETQFGYGLDAMQALTTALEGIRAVLDGTFGSVAWEGVLPEDSGFQRQIPLTFGPAFRMRLERLVDRECARYVRQLRQRGAKRRALRRAADKGRRKAT